MDWNNFYGLQARRKTAAKAKLVRSNEKTFPPLPEETREVLPTDCAAYHLNRQPQTLRGWACLGNGLLSPVRLGSRLGWRAADIRRLVKGEGV